MAPNRIRTRRHAPVLPARLLLGVLLAAVAPVHAAAPQDAAPANGAVAAVDPLREAVNLLASPDAEIGAQAVAAKTLLDAGALDRLRAVLSGSGEQPALAVLQALQLAQPMSYAELLGDIVALAAQTTSQNLRRDCAAALERLVRPPPSGNGGVPPAVALLLTWLADPSLDAARRAVVVSTLGSSQHPLVVVPLIEALEREPSAELQAALRRVTRHDPGPQATPAQWQEWWEKHRHLPREQWIERRLDLLLAEQDSTRQQFERERSAMVAEVVRSRITALGESVDGLLGGLNDTYSEVRLAAANRLTAQANREQATATVPALLRKLGHGNGAATAEASASTSAGGVGANEDVPDVRAALVTALAVLGRGREEARLALVAELQHAESQVTAAAATGLAQWRDQPALIVPLLDHLERVGDDDTAVAVLQAVAANRPSGLIERLRPWTDAARSTRVRSAAVRALMAEQEVRPALEVLARIFAGQPEPEVRYAIASALGERLRLMPAAEADRPELVALLGLLLDDPEVFVRAQAATALGQAAEAALSTLPELERTGESAQVEAARGLARELARPAVILLAARVRHEIDATVLRRHLEALGALRSLDGVAVLGSVLARAGDKRAALDVVAQEALRLMLEGRAAADWVAQVEALQADTPLLCAWTAREFLRLFPESGELRAVVRGRLATSLVRSGQFLEARTLLAELEANGAPHPPAAQRHELLASSCEQLEQWSAAADWRLMQLAGLPEGDGRRPGVMRQAITNLRKAERHVEAAEQLRALLELEGTDNQALFDLAQTEEALAQFSQAVFHYERLLVRLPAGDALHAQAAAGLARARQALPGAPPTVESPAPVVDPAPPAGTTDGAGAAPPERGLTEPDR